MATNLEASISRGTTTLTWEASGAITDFDVVWGLWFGVTSPVSTTGDPTYSFLANIGQESFEYTIAQTASQYVAVAAMNSDGDRGVSAELYLPWGTAAPNSPVNQVAMA
jgi:hypothetical protein